MTGTNSKRNRTQSNWPETRIAASIK